MVAFMHPQTSTGPRRNPWPVATAVMISAAMVVLDTTVVNVSLPHIAGSLSATVDEATWKLNTRVLDLEKLFSLSQVQAASFAVRSRRSISASILARCFCSGETPGGAFGSTLANPGR